MNKTELCNNCTLNLSDCATESNEKCLKKTHNLVKTLKKLGYKSNCLCDGVK